MNNMTEKLIKDGSENRRTKLNLTMILIGAFLIFVGLSLFVAKELFFEYVDANGVLHEKFYLIPVGFIFIFSGMITFFIAGLKNSLLIENNFDNPYLKVYFVIKKLILN